MSDNHGHDDHGHGDHGHAKGHDLGFEIIPEDGSVDFWLRNIAFATIAGMFAFAAFVWQGPHEHEDHEAPAEAPSSIQHGL